MATATALPQKKLQVQVKGKKPSASNCITLGKGARGKTIRTEPGWSCRTAEFKLADGTLMTGFVDLCDQDGGEHYGSVFYLPWSNTIVEQTDTKFAAKMGKSKEEIFPYSYRYNGWQIDCRDHHIDKDTGWSD